MGERPARVRGAPWLAAGASSVTLDELSNKFVDDGELHLGPIEAFNAGIEKVVGMPHPKLREAMMEEHCHLSDSQEEFEAGNYGIKTTSLIEWYVTAKPPIP